MFFRAFFQKMGLIRERRFSLDGGRKERKRREGRGRRREREEEGKKERGGRGREKQNTGLAGFPNLF